MQKFNVDLALKLSKVVHDECKDVPHDIGIKLACLVEDMLPILQQTPCTTHVCRCDAHTFYDWELEANKCSTCDGLIRQIA